MNGGLCKVATFYEQYATAGFEHTTHMRTSFRNRL
jgi:hypothetical protein